MMLPAFSGYLQLVANRKQASCPIHGDGATVYSTDPRPKFAVVVLLFTRGDMIATAAEENMLVGEVARGGKDMALPGQKFINGISNFVFGTNMPPDYVAHTVRNTPEIQARIKAGSFTLMRVAFDSTDSDAMIESKIGACNACGTAMLAILTRSSSSFNQHLVQYLGSRCNLYEFTNESDLNGWDVNTYIDKWNAEIPNLRRINPTAAFIGPALGVVAHFDSYLKPFLQACKSSGVIPDAVSFHSYPCTNTPDASECAPRAVNIGKNDVVACRNIVQAVFERSIPIGVTEWNIDANNPPKSYTQDASFNYTWTKNALKAMIESGCEIACQFDAASGAGYGLLDLVSTTSPYPVQVQYQPMVDAIKSYLNGGGTSSL
ncbi:hypothetical protein EPA93_45960 [Ktedonosporobacter rubrisoli]|uniref:Asl1-like glycosyl hydrolase catalytic domain-containing protein n=1 Tax=Ktedonosporobacter rubrisoli TaxID=2509675 RepID=A0A4V0Z0E3_KTERU|nr:hypothetical protein [Ktedonosporobacter rubrisoli]QBD82921.1 hypothetical protein EPA93_45960 [Ktedonosporobacter rubrisoli]